MTNDHDQNAISTMHPSVRGANLLLLLTMILLLTLGTVMQLYSFSLGLIGTQIFLLLLPTLLFLRLRRLPARETLRLRGLDPVLALLAFVIGVAIWPLAGWLQVLMNILFGYTVPVGPDIFPTTAAQALLLFLALAVAAAICEGVLIRGAIQRDYERYGPSRSIVLVGLIFAFFHMRLSGLLPLIPISLALGYVVWRSDSLLAGILTHAGNNLMAALLLIVSSLRPDLVEDLAGPSLPLAALGAALAIIGLWLFRRRTAPQPISSPPLQRSAFARMWPLGVAALLYVVVGGLELVIGRYPEFTAAGQRVTFAAAPWQEPVRWRYELRNVLDDPVGEADCLLSPQNDLLVLTCQMRQEAFEAQVDGSFWSSDDAEYRTTAVWRREDLYLVEAEGVRESDTLFFAYTITPVNDDLLLRGELPEVSEELSLPPDALVRFEWPWRLSALPFSLGYSREMTVAWPLRYRHVTEDSGPDKEEGHLIVRGATPIHTPLGNAIAWHVQVGDQQAWYDVEPPHHLLHYEDGFHTWLLVAVEDQ